MQTENRLFDDLAKMFNGAAGTFAGMTREAQAGFQERMKDWIGGMDFVSRDEFEAVKAMAAAARDENDRLAARLAALEAAAAPPTSNNAAAAAPPTSNNAASAAAPISTAKPARPKPPKA